MDTYASGLRCVDKKCKRNALQETLCQYASDTLDHIASVSRFCLSRSEWESEITASITKLQNIKERADRIELSFDSVKKSKNKFKAFGKFLKNKLTSQVKRHAELETELVGVIADMKRGLEKLNEFVEAVETLAVTSPHVFVENNRVLQLPEVTSVENVQRVIDAAVQTCPLLLRVKREACNFFSPSLHDVEVHSAYLEDYINITQSICDVLKESSVREFEKMENTETVVQLPADVSDGDVQDMLQRIKCLTDIREDQHFRVGFLFQGFSSGFTEEFGEREAGMLQCLTELEEIAVQLDRMKKGAQISGVTGSSVAVVSGVLGLVGLALTPVTAGASLVLTITGAALGITSAVNGAVTTGTELGVNDRGLKKAHSLIDKFNGDVAVLHVCLEEVSEKALENDMAEMVVEKDGGAAEVQVPAGMIINNGRSAGQGITNVASDAAALEVPTDVTSVTKSAKGLKKDRVGPELMGAGGVIFNNAHNAGLCIKNVANDAAALTVHDAVAKATVKGTLALSNAARVGFIGLNAIFIGWDLWSIVTGSMSLAKGSQSELSRFIRTKVSLGRSELDSWKKLHGSLTEGMATAEEKKAKLELPFYSVPSLPIRAIRTARIRATRQGGQQNVPKCAKKCQDDPVRVRSSALGLYLCFGTLTCIYVLYLIFIL